MNYTIIYNHPYTKSYCNAILKATTTGLQSAGHNIDIIDLDTDRFNPVMTSSDLKAFRDKQAIDPQVLNYQERLLKADHLIFIFPIWWSLMPAMTKGFIDKVMFPGLAYDYTFNGITMIPLLTNIRSITLITTMNTPKLIYRLKFANAIKKALIDGTFKMMGYKNCHWINFSMVKFVSQDKRSKWLTKLEQRYSKPK